MIYERNFFCAVFQVYSDFDCMLNQTNIGGNNNKYYIIQVLALGAKYYAWNRWGRVVSTEEEKHPALPENLLHMNQSLKLICSSLFEG